VCGRLKPNVPIALPIALALVLVAGGPLVTWWLNLRTGRAASAGKPTLDEVQLRTLPTYGLKCRRQSDCDDPLTCTRDPRLGGWACLASECRTDLQCEPGFVCTPYFHKAGVPTLRLCLIQGAQKEGERCEPFHMEAKHGCQPDLICGFGHCGRPCDLSGPSTCPEGFVCHRGNGVPLCLPSCLRTGCPPEKQCIRVDGEFSICGTMHGQDCDKQPCPQGEVCRREMGSRRHPEMVYMFCALPCNEEEGKSCPEGFTCVSNRTCYRLCDEKNPVTCDPGERCARVFGSRGSRTICDLAR
jgi:hypothetical protein